MRHKMRKEGTNRKAGQRVLSEQKKKKKTIVIFLSGLGVCSQGK